MSVFYKATNVNSLSFHPEPSGSYVVYTVGKTASIPIARRVPEPRLCSSSVLHASDTPSATLIGGKWPCRLFEVSGVPIVGPDEHKYGFIELRVEREIEAWRALGPNGQEVAAFIEAVKTIDAEQMRGVAVRDARDAARNARNAAWHAALHAAWNTAKNTAWDAAWVAARDATLALCVRDLISEEQFDLLYAHWEPLIPVASLRVSA